MAGEKEKNAAAAAAPEVKADAEKATLEAFANEQLAQAESKIAELTKENDELKSQRDSLQKSLDEAVAAKTEADQTINGLMEKLAENVNNKAASSVSTKPAKAGPFNPQPVEALGKKWVQAVPMIQHKGKTYNADQLTALPEVVAEIVAIEGQGTFKEVL